jgi:hypothetical protein
MTRLSTGSDSKQDYKTPSDFIEAVKTRFGSIFFDLAAHAENTQCHRYYAPEFFITKKEIPAGDLDAEKALLAEGWLFSHLNKNKKVKHFEFHERNDDPKAFAFDALARNWSKDIIVPRGMIAWLNCEFNDCETWAAKCAEEGKKGFRVVLLTPASVGANWARDHIFPGADVYFLNGRLCFVEGGDPYNKDCMLAVYGGAGATRKRLGWDWRNDVLF